MRPAPPGWGPVPPSGWGYPPPPRRPALGGVTILVLVTLLVFLAAPHARTLRDQVAAGLAVLPGDLRLPAPPKLRLPARPAPPSARVARPSPRAARAVRFALAQRGRPYRWGAEGPAAFDCSGLTWAAWRAAGVSIPRSAAGQLTGLPRVQGPLASGDLVVYASQGPSGRHVALVVDRGRMVEALGRGIPVRSTSLRPGWLGAVRPGGGR